MRFQPGFLSSVASAEPAEATFVTNTASASNGSSYSFSSVGIGTAASNRLVVVTVHWGGGSSASLTGGTIGGVTAEVAVTRTGVQACGIMSAPVPSGTTATIAVTLSASADHCGIGVWAATDVSDQTPSDTANATGTGDAEAEITVPTDGFVVAAAISDTTATVTWSGATEKFDASLASSDRYSGAQVTTAGSATIEVEAAAGVEVDLVAAAWR